MSFENPIKVGSNLNLGNIINNLIQKNISKINTCFIAKVVKVNDNKVSVIDLIKSNNEIENPIIHNCLVGLPYTNDFNLAYKLKNDDIGICIVCKQDITNYKNNGSEGVVNTDRLFNISDSIFIPLSLYKSTIENNKINAKSDFNIECEANFTTKSKGNIEIKATNNPVVIGNDIGTLISVVEDIISLLDLLASGMTGSTTNPSAYQSGKNAIIQKIKQVVG